MNQKMVLVAWFLAMLLLGCSPSETDIKTPITQTEATKPSSTSTSEPTNTFEFSPKPKPTGTYTPEPDPKPGLIFDAKALDASASPSLGSEVGDLDNDGDLDVLVVRKLYPPSIFINDGQGGFSLGEQEFPRYDLSDAGIKDLNSDGYPDIVLVGNGPNLVLFNDGAGGFPQIAQELGDGPSVGINIEDIDSDGDFDLFIAQYEAPLEIWFNNGAGHFEISEQVFVAANNRKFALGDLDGDGDLDAVIPRDFGESSVIYLNDGTGRYELLVESGLQTAGSNGMNASLGDVDGDGDLDILHNCHGCGDSIWINDGSAKFTNTGQSLSTGWSYDSEFADLDRDGDLDIVIANSIIEDQVWLNDGIGIFSQATTMPEQRGSTTVAIGDFDTDGDNDVFFARYNGTEIVWINKLRD